MATAGSRWAVVMSRNAGFSDQVCVFFIHKPFEVQWTLVSGSVLGEVSLKIILYWGEIWKNFRSRFVRIWRNLSLLQVVELDFLYPSEGIHQRWDNGYRITATAATLDQAAFILSIPRRKPNDETQETLRTSAFPSQHVKVTWPFRLIV